MIIFDWILFIFSFLFFISGGFIIISCFIGLVRFSDFFTRVHAIKISNIYGIGFLLIGIGLNSKDVSTFLQLLIVMILNILITIAVVHTICRIALNANIPHNGLSRRKYNEFVQQKEKEEAERKMQERTATQNKN